MSFGDVWSAVVVLLSAFVIGWGAEAAQTFLPRALALSVLAWLQTLPEFAVEATIAWGQQRDLMIANLTGSLRLLVGLGWPMIFFVHFFSEGARTKRFPWRLELGDEDSLSVVFLFLSIIYFVVILLKASLTCFDSIWLCLIYVVYLYVSFRLPVTAIEDPSELPWVARKIAGWPPRPRALGVVALFGLGGLALYLSAHPFVESLERLAVRFGIPTFVFVQWIAPFLSEFPEKVTAFNWARQRTKAPMAVMNMVSSNINQWTLLAAMIPIVFNLSLGHFEPVALDPMHRAELLITLAQSLLGGLLLLDLEFSAIEALGILLLWGAQFLVPSLRDEVTILYLAWCGVEIARMVFLAVFRHHVPRAFPAVKQLLQHLA